MMRKKHRDGESGFLMLEATFCMIMCMIVVMFLLSMGLLLYQKTLMGIVCNEIAEETVQVYKYKNAENGKEITLEDLKSVSPYRFVFQNQKNLNANGNRAVRWASDRLGQTSLAKRSSSLNLTIEQVGEGIGREHYVVTLRQNYTFLFGNILELVGLKGKMDLEATSVVEGMDIFHYFTAVRDAKYFMNKITELSNGLSFLSNAIKLAGTFFKMGFP